MLFAGADTEAMVHCGQSPRLSRQSQRAVPRSRSTAGVWPVLPGPEEHSVVFFPSVPRCGSQTG